MRAAKVKWIMPAYEALRAMPGMVYNQAIVTMYRDGTDAISWHNDKPKRCAKAVHLPAASP